MVQCEEGIGLFHRLLKAGIVHASRLGGVFHRLLIVGIDQYPVSETPAFSCSTWRFAASSANTSVDRTSRAGNRQAAMMLCCCDFFI